MLKFIKLREEHLEMVMTWRVKPEVTEYMLTNVKYDMDAQHKWFEKVSKDETYRYWVALYKDVPIGVLNLAAIDQENLSTSSGFYIGERDYTQLGFMIPPYLYNYIFKEMGFKKVWGEILAENKNVIQMHRLHGFTEVRTIPNRVVKNGVSKDVVLVEILAEDWLKQKRYQHYIAEFE